jgi:hypothetical protein
MHARAHGTRGEAKSPSACYVVLLRWRPEL